MTDNGVIEGVELARKVRAAIEDKKGEDIVLLDVRGLSSVTDYFLFVSGTSGPHLKAISGDVQKVLKEDGIHCYRRAGDPDSGWMTLDYVDVVIHIFTPEMRRYYAIEELWAEAPRPE